MAKMATISDDKHPQTLEKAPIKICPELKAFYGGNGIVDAEDLLDPRKAQPPRFVRLNPRYDKNETLSLLKVIDSYFNFVCFSFNGLFLLT
jgi:hypothetical protein